MALGAFIILLGTPRAGAANGTWTNNNSSNWGTASNWSGSTIADGSGFKADFSTITLSNNRTVTLDSSRAIGSLVFGNASGTRLRTWTLARSNNSVLTLAGDSTPTITISGTGPGAAVNISAILAGTQGLTFAGTPGTSAGSGILTLSGANTYTGLTTVLSGTLAYGSSNVIGSDGITVDGSTAILSLGNNHSDTVGTVTVANGGSITGSGSSTLTSTGTFEMQSGSVSAILAGTNIALNKTTEGIVTLSGINTYTGLTTITAGTLAYGASNVIGSGAVTIDGSTALLSLGASRTDIVGTVTLANGARITGTGTSALTSTGTFEMQGGSVSVILAGSNIALNKSTTDTVTLNGSNTYSGATTINAGTLVLAGGSGSIAASSGVTIAAGATLKLDNTSSANQTSRLKNDATVTMTGGTLDFSNNAGSANYSETAGALTLNSGTSTIATSQAALNQTSTLTFASLTRNAGASVNFVGTGLGVNGRNKIVFSTGPTLSNGILGAWATYNGSGFATYDTTLGIKEYTAYTNVSRLSSDSKTIANVAANNVRILEGTGTSGVITLAATVTNINSLYQSSSGGSGAATLNMESKTLRFGASGGILSQSDAGSLTLGTASNSGTLTAGGAANTAGILTVSNESPSAIIINSLIANNGTGTVSLAKGGVGTLTLNGTNSYSGATTVSNGTLQLGNASALGTTATGTTVGNGATLDLNGIALDAEALSLNGTGQNDAGALINSSANSASASGTVALGTASSIGGSGNLTLSGVISGGALTKIGEGTLTLNGTLANAHTGMTTVNAGTLVLGNIVVNGAIPGALTIGDGIGTDTVRIVVEGQIGNDSPVTINSSGVLEFEALTLPFRETIGTLTMTGGSVNTGIGTLFLSGNVTGNASATSATISGNLDLHANGSPDATGVRSFTIADGAATEDMVISAIIADGALSKEGAGTLILSGSNTYTGATEVNNGMLIVNNSTGSGTGRGVVGVRAGATLGGTGTIEGATSISGTHAPGGLTGPGTQTFTGSLSYMTGSIFEWELNAGRTDPANPVNAGAYDKVIANGAVGGTSVFNVVLGSKSFADAFWSTNKTWTNIFSGTGSYDLASIFASITVEGVSSSGLVRGYGNNGLFQFQGNNLIWSPTGEFSGVPEPSSAAAGLLRRKRG